MERKAIHYAREIVGDGLEIHAADTHLDGLAKYAFKGRHNRLQIHLFPQKSEADKVLGKGAEISVDQMDHRLDQTRAGLPADCTHHAEIEVG